MAINKSECLIKFAQKLITPQVLFKDKTSIIDVTPVYEKIEKNGKYENTNVLKGTDYTVVFKNLGYILANVFVAGNSIITAEQISENGGEIDGTFVNPTVNIYQMKIMSVSA